MDIKNYEEFINSSDILKSGIQPLLDKEIRELQMPEMILGQLVGRDTSLVNKDKPSKIFRVETTRMVAQPFKEGEDVPEIGDINFETIEVVPDYYGGGTSITAQAILDFDDNKDLIKWTLKRIADAMAISYDARILESLLNLTLVEDEEIAGGDTTFTLAHGGDTNPNEAIIAVTSLTTTNDVTWNLDYRRGVIIFSGDPGASTISYVYSADRKFVTVETPGEIGYDDIVNAKVSLRTEHIAPNGIVTDPLTIGMLLKDDKFIDASAFGEKVMQNGFIGRIAGMPIYSTDTMYDQVCVVAKWGPDLATVVIKELVSTDVQKMDKRPGDVWVQAWEKSMPVTIRPRWIRIIVNGQINAINAP